MPPAPKGSDQFLIVAIGASAGGLEPLEQFFESMPADSDMAFIVVQHLSPDHASALPELLSRCTPMSVEQARDSTEIVPNRVYIIPPNSTLTIKDCTLHVAPPQEARGHRTPIDRLFCSLAEDRGENAVCILLSGTGTDGTLGLRAVKEHGGMAMAQTLESAKYDAIIQSAIATGLVDHVLPVEEMPAKLTEYSSHLDTLNRQPNHIREQIAQQIGRIHAVLRARAGHDFSEHKDGTIVRRLERRMKASQIDSVAQYIEVLERQPEQADLLFQDLLIGVTGFFRDPLAFEVLGREVIPELFRARKAGGQIRVGIVGCATGEEAYSIAILLCEHASRLDDPPDMKIFATDIDERSLEAARRGLYPRSVAEDVGAERLDRFFTLKDNEYQVKRELREMCLFSSHNIIKDPPFSRLDLISCRNVMIYLGETLQRKMVPLLHYALRSGGYLFLGPSEGVNSHRDLFAPVDKRYRIFRRHDGLPRQSITFPLSEITRTRRFASTAAEASEPTLPKRLERIILQRYAPACVVARENGDALYFSGRISRYLEQPAGAPESNVVNMAREGLRVPLRAALHTAATTRERVVHKHIPVKTDGATSHLDVTVEPLSDLPEVNLYMVVIAEPVPDAEPTAPASFAPAGSEEIIRQLEGELRTAREHAQAMFEELESSNEELKSANEEYQSTNEELETSKEELQSFNEELETLNAELNRRVTELDAANSDLQNLLNSTQIATIFLDSELRIRNFTPAAGRLFRLIGGDIGRPITDLASQIVGADLADDARQVLTTLLPRERVGSPGTELEFAL